MLLLFLEHLVVCCPAVSEGKFSDACDVRAVKSNLGLRGTYLLKFISLFHFISVYAITVIYY